MRDVQVRDGVERGQIDQAGQIRDDARHPRGATFVQSLSVAALLSLAVTAFVAGMFSTVAAALGARNVTGR